MIFKKVMTDFRLNLDHFRKSNRIKLFLKKNYKLLKNVLSIKTTLFLKREIHIEEEYDSVFE